MALFRADGTRVTAANLSKSTAAADPVVTITEDLYESRQVGYFDTKPEGEILGLHSRAGTFRVRQSQVNSLFHAPVVQKVLPASGPAAGGTVVTITGVHLDGVTAVTFGGVAGTALDIVSTDELNVTAPAHAAGVVDLVLTGDTGDVTFTGVYTYV